MSHDPQAPQDAATCKPFEELLALDVGGDTTPEEQARLREHLASCAACRELAEGLASSQAALLRSAPGEPDDEALAALHDALSQQLPEASHHTASSPTVEGPWAANRSEPRRPSNRHAWLALAAVLVLTLVSARLWLQPPRDLDSPTPEIYTANHAADPMDTGAPPEQRSTVSEEPFQVADGTSRPAEKVPTVAEQPPEPPAPGTPEASDESPASRSPTNGSPEPNPEPRVALAAGSEVDDSSATVFKLVSDDPDLVIYWLVDPPTPTEEPTDATTI